MTTSNGTYGSYETKCWSWGFGFMFAIYLAGGISGAHLNPVISITLSIFRGFPWKRCFYYVIAQMFGGLVAGIMAFYVYRDAVTNFDPGHEEMKTGTCLYTVPQPFISTATAFFSEVVGGAILMCILLALGDDQNAPPGAGMNAFILGLLVSVLMMVMGYNTGPALNPARDFGPRLVALWEGYGSQTFTTGWWIYGAWAGPLVGTICGCVLYDWFIFTGGESPINYRLPSKKEIRTRWKQHRHKT